MEAIGHPRHHQHRHFSNNAIRGGLVAALIGTFSMATGTYLSWRWKNGMPFVGFTGWQLVLGGLFILPLAIVMEAPLPALTVSNWLAYGYLTILGTALAYALWFRGISKISPVAVSAPGFLSPVTALVLGWIFLGEGFGQRESIGIFIILTSVALLQASRPEGSPAVGSSDLIITNSN